MPRVVLNLSGGAARAGRTTEIKNALEGVVAGGSRDSDAGRDKDDANGDGKGGDGDGRGRQPR